VFKTAFGIFVNWLQARITSVIAVYVTRKQYSKYIMLDYLDFNNIRSSIMIRNILYNPTSYVQWIIQPLTLIVSEMFIVFLIVVAIAWYDLSLFGFILVTIGPATYLVYTALKKRGTRIGVGIDNVFPYTLSSLTEAIHGYVDVKLAGKGEKYKSRFLKHLKSYQELMQIANLL
jgi:ABC-type multidrug transport system fused ATPase/permease subunit